MSYLQTPRRTKDERGSNTVEAAIALPIFLAVLFISISFLITAYRMLRFQYDVSQVITNTFALSFEERGCMDYEAYMEENLKTRATQIGLNTAPNSWQYQYTHNDKTPTSSFPDPLSPGDTFSVRVSFKVPVWGGTLGKIQLPELTVRAKGIAVVQNTSSVGAK